MWDSGTVPDGDSEFAIVPDGDSKCATVPERESDVWDRAGQS